MTNSADTTREKYLNGMRKHHLHQSLRFVYEVLTDEACSLAGPDEPLEPRMAIILKIIESWVHRELLPLGETPDLAAEKRNLTKAFADLAQRASSVIKIVGSDPDRCRICGGPMCKLFYNKERSTCPSCVRPVITSLDQLVRATTDWVTPESILDAWQFSVEAVERQEQV